MLPISPRNSPQYTLTPEPAGVSTSIDQIGWAVESSDSSAVTMTSNDDDDTGMTATLAIPSDASVGAIISFWCVYRRLDGAEVIGGPWNVTVEAS